MRLIEIGLLLMLAALSPVLPVFRLPPPTGPLRVGTTLLRGGVDGLAVQVWYPADPDGSAPPAVYEPGTGGWRNRIFRYVRTGAVQDAPLAAGADRFPVLIYVHAWGGTYWENSGLMQELASHGYIVAASDQPDGSVDGIELSTSMDFSSPAAWHRTEIIAAVKLRIQVEVARHVLDRLSALDAAFGGRFAGRLDLAHAGILGFSFGGATAAEAATDPRFRAVVNMDGLLFGAARQRGVTVPYLELSDDELPPAERTHSSDLAARTLAQVQAEDARLTRANLARNGGLFLTIRGTLHPNFSDYPMLVPLRRFNGAGSIGPRRAARVIDTWVVGFFDHALKGKPLPGPAASPEALLEIWPTPAVTPPAAIDARARNAALQR